MIPPSSLKLLGGKLCRRRHFLLEFQDTILADQLGVVGLPLLASGRFTRTQNSVINLEEASLNGVGLFVIGVRVHSDGRPDFVCFHHNDGAFCVVGSVGGFFTIDLTHSLAALQIIDQFEVIK